MDTWIYGPITAGITIRGRVKRALRQAAWERNLRITIEEDKRLLVSLLRIEVTGPEADVNDFRLDVLNWRP